MSHLFDLEQQKELIAGAMMIVGLRAVLGERYPFQQAEEDWKRMSEQERECTRQGYRSCYPDSQLCKPQ
jgi:hypothetical protein